MKLKGDIAKFGQQELSDVSAFYTYPDGKVISSTEYGTLLLWEGMFIKCLLRIDEHHSCHKNNIEVIFRYEDRIVTAGGDGYVRFWDANLIDQAEGDDNNNFDLTPEKEVYIEVEQGKPASIMHIAVSEDQWIVQDAHGLWFAMDPKNDFAFQ